MNRSVGKKVVCEGMSTGADMTIGGDDRAGRPTVDEGEEVVVEPYGDHHEEGESGRVEEEVDLVQSMMCGG